MRWKFGTVLEFFGVTISSIRFLDWRLTSKDWEEKFSLVPFSPLRAEIALESLSAFFHRRLRILNLPAIEWDNLCSLREKKKRCISSWEIRSGKMSPFSLWTERAHWDRREKEAENNGSCARAGRNYRDWFKVVFILSLSLFLVVSLMQARWLQLW